MAAVYTVLRNRGLIRLSGPDAPNFLQALVTRDLGPLENGGDDIAVYACLLTPQGKFLHDFFVTRDSETGDLLLACEGGTRTEDLLKRLSLYRLRSKVTLSAEPAWDVYAVADNAELPGSWKDPRHPALGRRSFRKPESMAERAFEDWDEARIRLRVPDGSRDMPVESATLAEYGIDRLNGVSYDKGCYIGQELTARMHYRGLAKRHLYAVTWQGPAPAPFSDIEIGGKLIGMACSACGQTGLALLKDEHAGDNALFTIIGGPES